MERLLEILNDFANWLGLRAHTLLSVSLLLLMVSQSKIVMGKNGLSLTLLRSCLALLARLAGAARPAGPTAALPQIAQMEPIKTPFPRAPLGRAALHNALRRLNVAGECSSSSNIQLITPEEIRVAFLGQEEIPPL